LTAAALERRAAGVPGFADNARRIAHLAWPVFAGQIAVLGFSTVDTLLIARYAALDLAALAVGAAAYASIFVGFMGVVLAVGPIAGQFFGARHWLACGQQLHQAVWLALGIALLGCALLLFPQPFLWLAKAEPEVAHKVHAYLAALAFALPASLLFTAYRGFNIAVSRPKAVMTLQIAGLALKVPLSLLLIYGAALPTPFGNLALPALGLTGCGIATAIVMWAQLLAAFVLIRRDRFYAPFGLHRPGLARPDRAALRALLALGVPMGLSVLIEVTGFTFMSFFISRLGTTPVAGHQIAANVVAMMFMLPLGLANATGTLVAQRIGADDVRDARRLGWHGLAIGTALGALVGGVVFALRGAIAELYTHDALVVAAALPLLAWVGLFHLCDAAQTVAAFVLRAWRVATLPVVIYALALWGIGLGGGSLLAFDAGGHAPAALRGAPGFWAAATLGLLAAALGLCALLAALLKAQAREHAELHLP
jgi:MATE family multidrug resistance protein